MAEMSIAAIGIEGKDLMVLKSLLSLVSNTKEFGWRLVDDPAAAQIAFLGHLSSERVAELAGRFGDGPLLVYCCSRGEDAPSGVQVLGHCPPRASELSAVLAEASRRAAASAAALVNAAKSAVESAATARATRKLFDPALSLPGAIQAKLPKLLIDQPLLVSVPGAPGLLIDVHSGVRTAHGDPAWFFSPDFWRIAPASCQLMTAIDSQALTESRRYQARPIQALRFWGIMSASQGMPLADIARAVEVGLKKLPDFKLLPHYEWQRRLAESLVGKLAAPEQLASATGRPIEEIYDFLNAAAELGLLRIH